MTQKTFHFFALPLLLAITTIFCSIGPDETPPPFQFEGQSGGASGPARPEETLPAIGGADIVFHCRFDDPTCPEVVIEGDPLATIDGAPAPFRGYGDPSLEFDPETGELWLSYSWLDALIADPGPPPIVDLGVRTNLAVSRDLGNTFRYVGPGNETLQIQHPDSGQPGWSIHEVSTLVREDDAWQLLWLTYFDPIGEREDRSDFYYSRSTAITPASLGASSEAWAGSDATSPGFEARHNLNETFGLIDCTSFTEPALFNDGNATYLATHCVVIENGERKTEQERLVLLREGEDGYAYVGALLFAIDAQLAGADRLEQADLSFSRDGEILLIVTPIRSGEDPEHRGCIVYTVDDLQTAIVRRDAEGRPVPRAIITADGNGLGPGLCTYDPASESGVMMVLTSFDLESDPPDIEFSLHSTGIHP